METKVLNDIKECEKYWKMFSPDNSIYDLWDFRYAFWKIYQYPLYFIVLKNGTENIGLLPLWYIPEYNTYCWFGDIGDGSSFQEDNNFWIKDNIYLEILLKACPGPIKLYNLTSDCFNFTKNIIKLEEYNPKNVMDLKNLYSAEDYLLTLKRKLRSNLNRDKRHIDSHNPKIIFNNFSDFDQLVRLNIERNNDSIFKDKRMYDVFLEIIRISKKADFETKIISVYINNQPAGFDFILIFNNIYYPITCGYDVNLFSGIGNYLNLFNIEDAISLGMNKIDFGEGGYDVYKNKLFPVIPQYKIEQ